MASRLHHNVCIGLLSAKQLAATMRSEMARMGKVIKDTNIRAN
jgi:hypothetical protein